MYNKGLTLKELMDNIKKTVYAWHGKRAELMLGLRRIGNRIMLVFKNRCEVILAARKVTPLSSLQEKEIGELIARLCRSFNLIARTSKKIKGTFVCELAIPASVQVRY